ncbi:UTP--glucose-1-phosphate uridylyltransferase GalU [Massilia psychrophila]|uniref:UTP--glucose-1-phosphate uridylyltransferase n=1 Tax=Massilia psychrophila TaxID=1603353 RepID=A0A2G8T0M0_9BURK|nr:UTP--glucose-1-phosphate uridylyltransferase GalU [Massilia psychrophila]PIL39595.1 UTP--glucose-1-phosphate uridylyltransferase [Massilia psychrophila]GGE74143.1 UTP--glucose-1-phosphate uridylyltransferase [Massilia psychrophila]
MKKITKAVFPVAGLGSRFLPATKAQPKEMLPIVDKPLIQYAVEEAVAAGITEMIFITGRNKRAIEDHFDKAYELESELEAAGKAELLEFVRNVIPKSITCIYIRQSAPLGLGHAVLCARPVVGDQPFAVLLADDFMDTAPGQKPVLAQMTDLYGYEKCSILAVQDVPRAHTRQYGIVSASPYRPDLELVSAIVEKPRPEDAPSTLAVVGRYVLSPRIFDYLEHLGTGTGGEIQLTDGIAALMVSERVLAYRYAGQRYDCGSKLGYLKAMTAMGLKHPETGEGFRAFLDQMHKEQGQHDGT